MAVYLAIERIVDDFEIAEYKYSTADGRSGRLSINRISGEIQSIVFADGELEGELFARASHKVRSAWQKGALPKKLCWAS